MSALPPEFFLRLLLTLGAVAAVTLSLYLSARPSRDVLFSYLMFGLVIYLFAYVLKSTEVSVGFGFGLFAVFGILRYRTEAVSTRDLTYLMIVIALAMIGAVANVGLATLALFDALLVLGAVLAQWVSSLRPEACQQVIYERIELIRPERRQELMQDLRARLGVETLRVEVGEVNFLRDTVMLRVMYRPQPNSLPRTDLAPTGTPGTERATPGTERAQRSKSR